jgi:hypothetical protein
VGAPSAFVAHVVTCDLSSLRVRAPCPSSLFLPFVIFFVLPFFPVARSRMCCLCCCTGCPPAARARGCEFLPVTVVTVTGLRSSEATWRLDDSTIYHDRQAVTIP